MSIFAQDIEQAAEQSFIAPGSKFYEDWFSKSRNPDAWKCTYNDGTLSINLSPTSINQVTVQSSLPLIKTNDFFKDYLPGLQMIDCPKASVGIQTRGDIDCHNVTIRADRLSPWTPHTIQNVKFIASQGTSVLRLTGATKIINLHMVGGELSLEYDTISADHPWGLYLPEFINSSIDDSTSISIITPERQKMYDELWVWIDWKALGIKHQPTYMNQINVDVDIVHYNETTWNVVPVREDVCISDLLPLPDILLRKRQYLLYGAMLSHNAMIARKEEFSINAEMHILDPSGSLDKCITKDGYIILI